MGYYDRDRKPNSVSQYAAGQMNHAAPSHNNTAEYQSSGIPFVHTKAGIGENNSTVHVFTFPFVTRWLMVQVVDGTDKLTLEGKCKIGFANGGTALDGDQYVNTQLTNNTRLELKCTKVFLMVPVGALGTGTCDIQIIAGLTGVPNSDFPELEGAIVTGDHNKFVGINDNTGIYTTTTAL